ncbi:MAG: hypothetical protein OES46_15335 [Gammaproteobacteria bacterium]|nr:hypothetical protein [Gammaproteobacteria bacterium]
MRFSDEMIQQVWEKGRATLDQDSTIWRKDECGAWMNRAYYGNERSEYGWKIENVSTGGPDILENLRPLHRHNTFDRANHQAKCRVAADRAGLEPSEHIKEPRNRNA